MLNITGEVLPLGSRMAPRLEVNLFPQFAREALGPPEAGVMLDDVFDRIRVDIVLMRTYVV